MNSWQGTPQDDLSSDYLHTSACGFALLPVINVTFISFHPVGSWFQVILHCVPDVTVEGDERLLGAGATTLEVSSTKIINKAAMNMLAMGARVYEGTPTANLQFQLSYDAA